MREENIIRPCYTKTQGRLKYSKMTIGDNVFIDKDNVIQALKIGNNVVIGKSCIIGQRSQIHDNAKILDNSILPPDTVVPPNTVYGGRPAQFIAELPESVGYMNKEFTTNYYNIFVEYKGPMPSKSKPTPSASSQVKSTRSSVQLPPGADA